MISSASNTEIKEILHLYSILPYTLKKGLLFSRPR